MELFVNGRHGKILLPHFIRIKFTIQQQVSQQSNIGLNFKFAFNEQEILFSFRPGRLSL